jgi:hypothetical protein
MKTMSRFKTVKPLMVYLPPGDLNTLKRYAKNMGKPVSQVVREGVSMRLADSENPYNEGMKAGLIKAVEIMLESPGSKMRFPSGKSFGEMVRDEIVAFARDRFRKPEEEHEQEEPEVENDEGRLQALQEVEQNERDSNINNVSPADVWGELYR